MEFNIGNRRFKLYPDGVIKSRAIMRGKETKKIIWKNVYFNDNGNGYLICTILINGIRKNLRKHRILYLARNPGWDIFDNSSSNCIDHINHSRTDNSVENLRVVTSQQNQFNRSNTKGYYWNKKSRKWKAQITVNGKRKYLGLFKKEENARAAYLAAKEKYHKFNNELTTEDLEEIAEYNASF
jgi:hypothetical protein